MKVTLILGSGRQGRQSEKVALWMRAQAEAFGFEVEYLDVADYPKRFTGDEGENFPEFKQKMVGAQAYIIVAPEYNAGYPGELKILLDAFYMEYMGKPVGFVGVSERITAGARVVEMLKMTTIALNMIPIRTSLHFQKISEDFANGEPNNPETAERVKAFFEELTLYAETLLPLQGS